MGTVHSLGVFITAQEKQTPASDMTALISAGSWPS